MLHGDEVAAAAEPAPGVLHQHGVALARQHALAHLRLPAVGRAQQHGGERAFQTCKVYASRIYTYMCIL